MLIGSPLTILKQDLQYLRLSERGSRAWGQCGNSCIHCGCSYHLVSCLINRHFIEWEERIMARKGKGSQKTPQFSTTFVRCELTAEDRKKIPAWVGTKDFNVEDLASEVMAANHKISFSFNENTDSFICSVTGKPEDCDNASKCYTSHAKTWLQALQVAMYKYHVIFRGEAWEDVGEESDFG